MFKRDLWRDKFRRRDVVMNCIEDCLVILVLMAYKFIGQIGSHFVNYAPFIESI